MTELVVSLVGQTLYLTATLGKGLAKLKIQNSSHCVIMARAMM